MLEVDAVDDYVVRLCPKFLQSVVVLLGSF
jgi:hypothetical protein